MRTIILHASEFHMGYHTCHFRCTSKTMQPSIHVSHNMCKALSSDPLRHVEPNMKALCIFFIIFGFALSTLFKVYMMVVP